MRTVLCALSVVVGLGACGPGGADNQSNLDPPMGRNQAADQTRQVADRKKVARLASFPAALVFRKRVDQVL